MKSQRMPVQEAMPDTAESWVARLSSPEWSEADRLAFEAWCAEGDNGQAFARAERVHESVRGLASDPFIRAAAAAARRRASPPRARLRPAVWFGAAASLALAVIATTLTRPAVEPQRYASQVGERREIRLDDGTRALLDTDSEIAVRYTGSRREMTVVRGRVDIDVAQEPGRPFVTLAANGTINDIGTRFQVARSAREVTVTLLDGEVSIETAGSRAPPTVLAPGTQARYGAGGEIARTAADMDAANGWTRGELVFKNRSLAELVDEMNRYSTTRIRLAERGLDGIVVSGVFHAGDQEALIKALESGWSLRAERPSGKEIVLRAPQRR